MWAEGSPEGCAIALPRGNAGGGVTGMCRRGAAVGNRRMPWEASYVGGGVRRGCTIALPRGRAGGAPEGCRCWEPPRALGGLLCGRRGAP